MESLLYSRNIIERIAAWNKAAGLLEKEFSPWLESAFQIEEALEGFDLAIVGNVVNFPYDKEINAKNIARHILAEENKTTLISEVDILDKACDAIIFAVGTMTKLKLSPEQIEQALHIVMDANNQKLINVKHDAAGKVVKPVGMTPPEFLLKNVLDGRK